MIPFTRLDRYVIVEEPLPSPSPSKSSDVELAIGRLIASELVEDGATLQIGYFHSYFEWFPGIPL